MTTAAEIARDLAQEMNDRSLFEVECSCCGRGMDTPNISQSGIDFLERKIKEAVKTLTYLPPVDDFRSIGELVKGIPAQAREAMNGR